MASYIAARIPRKQTTTPLYFAILESLVDPHALCRLCLVACCSNTAHISHAFYNIHGISLEIVLFGRSLPSSANKANAPAVEHAEHSTPEPSRMGLSTQQDASPGPHRASLRPPPGPDRTDGLRRATAAQRHPGQQHNGNPPSNQSAAG